MTKTLHEQLRDVVIAEVNEAFWDAVSPPTAAHHLAARWFVEGVDRRSFKARVVIRFLQLLNTPTAVPFNTPGVEP